MSWNCEPCGKNLSSYKNLWRHRKVCKGMQKVLCQKCSRIMSQLDYVSHRNNCKIKPNTKEKKSIYEQLRDAGIENKEQQSIQPLNSDTEDMINDTSDEDITDEEEDTSENEIDVWKTIADWCLKNEIDALDGFKYWFEFCKRLDNDSTIQKIMETVHALRDDDQTLTFKDVLQYGLIKRKYLIYETLSLQK